MRLTRISFSGYKRLLDTSCNVDGKLIAFVGPNEAGKSSVLQGLRWFTDGKALPDNQKSRGVALRPDHLVVTVAFTLEGDDFARVADVPTDQVPATLFVGRQADGQRKFWLEPKPTRPAAAFVEAHAAAERVRRLINSRWADGPQAARIHQLVEKFELSIEQPDMVRRATHDKDFESLEQTCLDGPDSELLRSPEQEGLSEEDVHRQRSSSQLKLERAFTELAVKIREVRTAIEVEPPDEVLLKRFEVYSPEFLFFDEGSRVLQSSYNLYDEELAKSPPPALSNLLWFAGTSMKELATLNSSGNKAELRTKLRHCNLRLEEEFKSLWRQSELSVNLTVDGGMLDVMIEEFDENRGVAPIDERSDGLKLYLALTCFLRAEQPDYPVILLIDEAETHLHLDAQADLIQSLEREDQVAQVLYTTHSPGCLPQDLGTGIRLVEPVRSNGNVSRLRNNFWDSNVPGFSSMLFSMGAGAAAFSACRAAVVCEGAAEMLLLPTLLKAATGLSNLGYQVAPGLASYAGDIEEFESVASFVAYLVDGDDGGSTIKRRLMDSGVKPEVILSLPYGQALEDLIEPLCYVQSVIAIVREGGVDAPVPELEDLGETGTIAARLKRWLKSHDINTPGKVSVASRLARSADLILAEGSGSVLRNLHADFARLLSVPNQQSS